VSHKIWISSKALAQKRSIEKIVPCSAAFSAAFAAASAALALAFIFKTVSAVSVAVFSADVRASVTFSSMTVEPKRASHADKEGHVALADWMREAPLVERSGEGSTKRPWMILQRKRNYRGSKKAGPGTTLFHCLVKLIRNILFSLRLRILSLWAEGVKQNSEIRSNEKYHCLEVDEYS
jgi:hypothetical protein